MYWSARGGRVGSLDEVTGNVSRFVKNVPKAQDENRGPKDQGDWGDQKSG